MKIFGLIAIIALLFLAACSGDEIKLKNVVNSTKENSDSGLKVKQGLCRCFDNLIKKRSACFMLPSN